MVAWGTHQIPNQNVAWLSRMGRKKSKRPLPDHPTILALKMGWYLEDKAGLDCI